MKSILSLSTLFLGLALAAAPAVGAEKAAAKGLSANPVMLHDYAVVTGNFVRLGDLFANAGDKANTNVAYAPEPGEKATFDYRWLAKTAQTHKLDWRPLSRLDQITVQRDSVAIAREEIEERILAALADKGVGSGMEAELSNRATRINLPVDAEPTLAVEDVVFDARTQRFTALVAAPAGDPKAKRHRFSGIVYRVAEVPTLNRRVLAGEMIAEKDIQWIKLRADRMQNDTIANAGDLIGRTPKQGLRPGIPVRLAEVRRPVLVPKNGLVTMTLHTPLMMLTAQGIAQEDGSEGDTIRIMNTKSRTLVEAVVTGASKAAVRTTTHVLSN
ncbi:MAG: flagellar basal body P-ring formation chaperone FlgA [Magnetospirillum sp. WYHS-4]